MTEGTSIAILTGSAALLGTVAGSIASYFTARTLKRDEWRREQRLKDIAVREELYVQFYEETSYLMLNAIDGKISGAKDFHRFRTLMGKLEFLASPEVVEKAKALSKKLSHTLPVAHEVKEDQKEEDKFGTFQKAFIAAARREIDGLKASG
jgi:hypothetical protein